MTNTNFLLHCDIQKYAFEQLLGHIIKNKQPKFLDVPAISKTRRYFPERPTIKEPLDSHAKEFAYSL